jgi:hypothetical protein
MERMQKEMGDFAEGCDNELLEVISNIRMLNKNIDSLWLMG